MSLFPSDETELYQLRFELAALSAKVEADRRIIKAARAADKLFQTPPQFDSNCPWCRCHSTGREGGRYPRSHHGGSCPVMALHRAIEAADRGEEQG